MPPKVERSPEKGQKNHEIERDVSKDREGTGNRVERDAETYRNEARGGSTFSVDPKTIKDVTKEGNNERPPVRHPYHPAPKVRSRGDKKIDYGVVKTHRSPKKAPAKKPAEKKVIEPKQESKDPTGPSTSKEILIQTEKPEYKGYAGSKVNLPETVIDGLIQTIKKDTAANSENFTESPRKDLHITLVDAVEIKRMVDDIVEKEGISKSKARKKVKEQIKEQLQELSMDGDPVITGIGKATDPETGHTVFFATVHWPEAHAWRKKQGLGDKDLHITLGSTAHKDGKPLDVHGVPKKPNVVQFASASNSSRSNLATKKDREIDGLVHTPVSFQEGSIKDLPTSVSTKAEAGGLDSLVKQMEVGQVYRLTSYAKDEAKTLQTNYLFRDQMGNLYIVQEWLAKKIVDHKNRGSHFTLSLEAILSAMAEAARYNGVTGKGRYEMHTVKSEGSPVGMDSVITDSAIANNSLKGKKVTVKRELDTVEIFVVSEKDMGDAKQYGTSQLHSVFFDGNPKFAEEVADALKAYGITPESWSAENQGRIRVPVTIFPGKFMPARDNVQAWQGHRELKTEGDYQTYQKAKQVLIDNGVLDPVLKVREELISSEVSPANLYRMLETGSLSHLPETSISKIKEKIKLLEDYLGEEKPNSRNIKSAKLKVLSFVEAALLKEKGVDPATVKPGLISQNGTPHAYQELSQ